MAHSNALFASNKVLKISDISGLNLGIHVVKHGNKFNQFFQFTFITLDTGQIMFDPYRGFRTSLTEANLYCS